MINDEEFLKVRKICAGIVYDGDAFKVILDQYDKGDPSKAVNDALLGTLADLQKQLGASINLEMIFAAGVVVFEHLISDIKATGRKSLTDEQQANIFRSATLHYLFINKGKYDPEELKRLLGELQTKPEKGLLAA